MKARDVMTRGVVTIEEDASILTAIRLMLMKRISGLPVTDAGGHLAGIITEGDLLRRVETGTKVRSPRWIEFLMGPGALAQEYVHESGRKVGEVMTREVRTATEDTPVDKIVDLMERYNVKRVPVVSGKQLIGIVTRANLIRALAAASLKASDMPHGDATIREKILAGMDKEKWAPRASVDVAVHDGVVTFSGAIFDDRLREALKVMAENIPGVKRVQDRIALIEPMSGTVIEPQGRAS
jgi:CBS domain-containing protein